MKTALFIIITLFLASCSSIRPLSSFGKNAEHSPDSVEFGGFKLNEDGTYPELIQNEETVRLGARGGDVYTPGDGAAYVSTEIAKKMRFGLSLGPGLYRAINYVALLKYLDKENLSPRVLTGTGFGGVVAAMYASGMTPEVMEWNFYRYFKEKRNYRVYSTEWLEEIDRLLLSKITVARVEDTKRKFYLTLYNSKNQKTYFFEKGNMRNLLRMNLRLSKETDHKSKKIEYTSSLESEVFNLALLKKMGVDFAIGADVLGEKFEFNDRDDQLLTIFKDSSKKIRVEKSKFDFFFTLPVGEMSLDSTENGPMYLMNSQRFINNQSNDLKTKIRDIYYAKENVLE